MNDAAIQSPNSYMDFAGLGRLRGQAHSNGTGAAKETGQQFEAMFIQMMLKSMRDATPKDEDRESSGAMDTYQSMFDQEVASAMAKRHNLGIADLINQQLSRAPLSPAEAQQKMLLRNADPNAAAGLPLQRPVPSLPLRNGDAQGLPLPAKAADGYPISDGAATAPKTAIPTDTDF